MPISCLKKADMPVRRPARTKNIFRFVSKNLIKAKQLIKLVNNAVAIGEPKRNSSPNKISDISHGIIAHFQLLSFSTIMKIKREIKDNIVTVNTLSMTIEEPKILNIKARI